MEARELPPQLQAALEPDEEVQIQAPSTEAILAVTSRRIMVAEAERLALAVPFDRVRRIQFDIERARPATLIIVPEHSEDEPQVLSIPPRHYAEAARAIVAVGLALAEDRTREGGPTE